MMIGSLIMGTTAAAAGDFSGFTHTPDPQWIDDRWWSFTTFIRDTPPVVGILSKSSIDNAVTWVDNNTTFHTSFAIGTDHFINNIIGGVGGSFVNHKDLSTGADWIFTNVSSLAGGFIVGGINLLHSDETNNLFILNKAQGRDLYTSTDLVTYTPINGVTENDLTLNNRLIEANWIVYVGGQYVAYGVKVSGSLGVPDTYGTASSADLITWAQETPDVPIFFDISYFNGAYLGVHVAASNAKTDIVSVWRSTDFINWTQQVIPDADQGSSIEDVIVESGTYSIISNSQVFKSADGITFTTTNLKFNLIPTVAEATGRGPKLSLAGDPSIALARTVDYDEFGGKILGWSTGFENNPTLIYPLSNPANEVVGFTSSAALSGAGVSGNGFIITDSTAKQGFYLHKLGVRYFEATILSHPATISGKIGIVAPAANFFSGLNITSVQLSSTGLIETTSGDLPVSYTMEANQVIGFIVNFITAEVIIKVDDIILATIPNLATSVLWTQLITASNAGIKLNVGQDAFIYPQVSTVPWADEYL